MKICVKHLVQYQAHSNNPVHYCYFHYHDDQTSWNLLFTSQGPSVLADVFSFIIISVIVDFFPTKTLVCFETFWLPFSERLSHFCSPYTPFFFFAFLLSLSTVHSFIPSLSFIHLFNKYLLKPAMCQALFTPCTNPLTPESTKTLRLSVLASSCEHR